MNVRGALFLNIFIQERDFSTFFPPCKWHLVPSNNLPVISLRRSMLPEEHQEDQLLLVPMQAVNTGQNPACY
jgi:hypothetical protein